MEEGAGMEEEILWEMGSIADCLTLRRLRGGGKNSRQRIFGGWRNACNHRKLATPRDRFALAPPPASGGG